MRVSEQNDTEHGRENAQNFKFPQALIIEEETEEGYEDGLGIVNGDGKREREVIDGQIEAHGRHETEDAPEENELEEVSRDVYEADSNFFHMEPATKGEEKVSYNDSLDYVNFSF